MHLPLFPLLLLASAACAAGNRDSARALSTTAAGANLHTASNPASSFDGYRTFSFGTSEGPPAGYQTSPRSAEVHRRLQPLIVSALTQRGYVPVPEKGDIFIMFGSGRRDVSIHESSSVTGEWLPDDENEDFVEGSLVIDAFDAATNNKVWHGASRANIDPDRIDDQRLKRSVQELLSSFPAAKANVRGAP